MYLVNFCGIKKLSNLRSKMIHAMYMLDARLLYMIQVYNYFVWLAKLKVVILD